MNQEQSAKILALAMHTPPLLSLYYQAEGYFYEVLQAEPHYRGEDNNLPPEIGIEVETIGWVKLSEVNAGQFKLALFMDAV